MWYAGAKDLTPGPRPRQTSQTTRRTRSQTTLGAQRGCRGSRQLSGACTLGGNPSRQIGSRGAFGSERPIGKNPTATAAALLALSSIGEREGSGRDTNTGQSEEVIRLGNWSVRKAPGGPDAGLFFVNVETGRAQREPPQDVLDELGVDENGHDLCCDSGESAGNDTDQMAWSGEFDTSPSSSFQPAQFQRLLIAHRREVPLAMARDIREALAEDPSLFEQVRQRFSDAPPDEILDFDSLSGETQSVVQGLGRGEISDVVATDVGMEIVYRRT